MPSTIAVEADRRHRELPEKADRVVKADLRKAEMDAEWRRRMGQAVQRACSLRGWSLKEAAAAFGRDPRQVARWIEGTERAQFDVLFGEASFQRPLVIALAELIAGDAVDVETTVRIRRIG